MSKKLLAYWIISTLLMTFLITFVDTVGPYLKVLIFLIIIVYGLYLIRNNANQIRAITYIYLVECDPYRCIEQMKLYYKGIIKSKRMKTYIRILYAILYIDSGDVNNAVDTLCSVIEEEPKMSDYVRFWYYKAWASIYFEKNLPEQMKKILDQLKILVDNTNKSNYKHHLHNYNILLAKYYILTDIYLDTALDTFETVYRENPLLLNRINALFYIGIINRRRHDIAKAHQCFEDVIKTKRVKLNAYQKAEFILTNEQIVENE